MCNPHTTSAVGSPAPPKTVTVKKNVHSRGQSGAIHRPPGVHFAVCQPSFLEISTVAPGRCQRPRCAGDIKFIGCLANAAFKLKRPRREMAAAGRAMGRNTPGAAPLSVPTKEQRQRDDMTVNPTPQDSLKRAAAGRAVGRNTPGAAPLPVPTRSRRPEEQWQRNGLMANPAPRDGSGWARCGKKHAGGGSPSGAHAQSQTRPGSDEKLYDGGGRSIRHTFKVATRGGNVRCTCSCRVKARA